MSLSLDLLKTFIVFAESRNIFEAADKLGLSQPAVSVQIKVLESHFGQPLFGTKGKKKVLNPFGKSLYDSVHPKVKALEKGTQDIVKKYMNLSDVTLRIAGRREILTYLSQFSVFPGKILFLSLGKDEAIRKLIDHQIDIAISQELPDVPNIFSKKIYSNGIHLVVHKDLAPKKDFDTEFVQSTPFISYKEPLPYIFDWLDHQKISKELLNTRFIIDDWDAIIRLVEAKKGFALTPNMFQSQNSKVISIPISERVLPKVNFYALYNEDVKKLFPIEKIFKLIGSP